MAPVLRALAARPEFSQTVLLTGQHPALAPDPDWPPGIAVQRLAVDPRHQTAGEICELVEFALYAPLRALRPDMVIVHGDTSSALAGARAAAGCRIPIAHVEAGLRSHDLQRPWPEEGNRIAIDALSTLLFAPTERAALNLAQEAVGGAVSVTGNSGIDALFHARDQARPWRAPGAGDYIVATCHRRGNRGAALAGIAQALRRIAREMALDVVFILHPNPHVRAPVEAALAGAAGVTLVEPLDYREMVALIAGCWVLLTDSGGLQEEGAALGKPVLVLRSVTERPEAAANLELVGADPERICAAVARLRAEPRRYARMATPSPAFGDGRAAQRIADALLAYFALPPAARPRAPGAETMRTSA